METLRGHSATLVAMRRELSVRIEENSRLDEVATREQSSKPLGRYKAPQRAIIDDLPRNTMGEEQKAALRQTYAALYDAPGGKA